MVGLARAGPLGDEWEAAREVVLKFLETSYVYVHITHKEEGAVPVVPGKEVINSSLAGLPDCSHV